MNAGTEDLFRDHQRALDVNDRNYLKLRFHCVFKAHLLGVALVLFIVSLTMHYTYPH